MPTTYSLRSVVLIVLALVGSPVVGIGQPDDPALEVRLHDRIIKKNGDVVECTVLDETPNQLWVELKGGNIETGINREDIAQWLRRNPPAEVYKERKRRLDITSAAQQRELGEWCLSEVTGGELGEPAVMHLEIAVKLDSSELRIFELLLGEYSKLDDRQKTLPRRDAEMGVCLRGLAAGHELPALARRAATHLLLLDDAEGAAEMLERALALGPDEELRQSMENELARLYESTGQRDKARVLVDRILAEDAGRAADLLLLRAKWLLESVAGGEAGARAQLDQVRDEILELDPENGPIALIMASAEALAGDLEGAKVSLGKAAGRGEVGYPMDLTFSLILARSGDDKPAEQLVSRAQNVTAPVARELYHLIRAYYFENRGENEAAWTELQEAVSVEGASWQTWLVYLSAVPRLSETGAMSDVVDYFIEQFGSNSTAFAEAAILRGDIALRDGDGPEARRWLAYAREELGDDFEMLLRAGLAELLEGGDLSAARTALEAAYAIEPVDHGLRNALGCLEYRLGNLAQAERWFTGVLKEFDQDELEGPDANPVIAYAQRGLRQIDGALREERWIDEFTRADSGAVLNNWESQVNHGVAVEQRDGAALFEGEQQFVPDGLTSLTRVIESERLSRVRVRIRLDRGADLARPGLRFTDRGGSSGIVFGRDPDGALMFSLLDGGGAEEFRPPAEGETNSGSNGDGASPDDPYEFKRVIWEEDEEWHLLEIRLDPDRGGAAELYFDGERVARNIKPPNLRSEIRVGVSGQAALGVSYRFWADDFEVYRKRPRSDGPLQR